MLIIFLPHPLSQSIPFQELGSILLLYTPSFGELPGGALVEPTTTTIITQATLHSY